MIGYIYYIINTKTKERYVGKTINIKKRLADHKNKLNKNIHINKKLQRAWNQYGEDSFIFEYETYELKDLKDLNTYEIDNITKYDSYKNGYNLTIGGDGGNTRGKLTFEEYCFIYIGCQWKGYTEKIGKYLGMDSSSVSAILREKAYLWFKEEADNLTKEEKEQIIDNFRQVFNIATDKPFDEKRTNNGLTEEEYFYCLCVAASHGRGVEAALARFFSKHKSFLSNGMKGEKGKAFSAHQRFLQTSDDEIQQIGKQKFKEWNIQSFCSQKIYEENKINKWRN